MIIINKSKYLKYKNLKFRCSFGKKGIGIKQKEGDNVTPRGTFKILNIYYREDRIKKFRSKFKMIKIKKNMGWCDDVESKSYNKLIRLPCKYSYENLYRQDNIYDLIAVTNYNTKPIIKKKGSAIFIHLTKNLNKSTKGCVAILKKDFLKLLLIIDKKIKVQIN